MTVTSNTSSATKPVLAYFNIRGRAEPIRLLLEDAGVEYEQKNCSACWPAEKPKKEIYYFGQCPALILADGKSIVQQDAIMRHLAREYNYYGTNNTEAVNADMMAAFVEDMKMPYVRMIYGGDFENQVGEFTSVKIPGWLESVEYFLETVAKCSQDKGFVAGGHITFADWLLFDVLLNFTYLDANCLDKFPLTQAWFKRLESRPSYVKYVASGRRPAQVNNVPHGTPKA